MIVLVICSNGHFGHGDDDNEGSYGHDSDNHMMPRLAFCQFIFGIQQKFYSKVLLNYSEMQFEDNDKLHVWLKSNVTRFTKYEIQFEDDDKYNCRQKL